MGRQAAGNALMGRENAGTLKRKRKTQLRSLLMLPNHGDQTASNQPTEQNRNNNASQAHAEQRSTERESGALDCGLQQNASARDKGRHQIRDRAFAVRRVPQQKGSKVVSSRFGTAFDGLGQHPARIESDAHRQQRADEWNGNCSGSAFLSLLPPRLDAWLQ